MDAKTIASKQFVRGAFGSYKSDDVDAFFQEVVSYVQNLEKEQEHLLRDMKTLAAKVEEYQASEDAVQEALIKAQKYGNKIINDAETEAEEIASVAKSKAAETITLAQEKAHVISNEAMEQTEQLIRELKDKALTELNELKQKSAIERKTMENAKIAASTFKADLFELYRAHLDLINRIPDLSETDYQPEALPTVPMDEQPQAELAQTTQEVEPMVEEPVAVQDEIVVEEVAVQIEDEEPQEQAEEIKSEEEPSQDEQPEEIKTEEPPQDEQPEEIKLEEPPEDEQPKEEIPEQKSTFPESDFKEDTSVIPTQVIDGDLTPDDVRRTIHNTAKPVYGRKFTDLKYGSGK